MGDEGKIAAGVFGKIEREFILLFLQKRGAGKYGGGADDEIDAPLPLVKLHEQLTKPLTKPDIFLPFKLLPIAKQSTCLCYAVLYGIGVNFSAVGEAGRIQHDNNFPIDFQNV